jgi:hypothetical protein
MRSIPSASMSNSSDSQRLATILRELGRLTIDTGQGTNHFDEQIAVARSIIRFLDQTSLLERAASLNDQVYIASRLQRLAYYEPDSGGIRDIAQWCLSQWLRMLQRYSESVEVLQGLFQCFFQSWTYPDVDIGLGQAWLSRSQMSLARIHLDEAGSSGGFGRASSGSFDLSPGGTYSAGGAEDRRHTADYVEARGTLIPATEYLTRAVNLAEREGSLRGELLALVSLLQAPRQKCASYSVHRLRRLT